MLKRYSHTQEEAKKAAIQKLGKYAKITTIEAEGNIDPSTDNNVVALIDRK